MSIKWKSKDDRRLKHFYMKSTPLTYHNVREPDGYIKMILMERINHCPKLSVHSDNPYTVSDIYFWTRGMRYM